MRVSAFPQAITRYLLSLTRQNTDAKDKVAPRDATLNLVHLPGIRAGSESSVREIVKSV